MIQNLRLSEAIQPRRVKSRFEKAPALFAAFLFLCSAFSAAGAQESDARYRIGVGDSLQVAIYGDDRLSGKFRVGPDGAISYPLIGSLEVNNLTTEEVGLRLAERLKGRIAVSGSPTVEVVEYAPVFVTGDVEKPGPYQFRPGMIALELVALGGGLRRASDVESGLMQLAAAEQDASDLKLLHFSQVIQRARLQAELNGQNFVPPRVEGLDYPIPEVRTRIIANETAIFQVRADVIKNQLKSLTDQRAGYENEISSLNETIVLHEDELKILQQELATQEALVAKGLSVQQKALDLRRELSATRRNDLDFRLALARAKQRLLEIEQRLSDIRNTQANENSRDLRDLDLSIERTAGKVASLVTTLTDMRSAIRDSRYASLRAPVYTVVRLEDNRRIETVIQDFTELQPRDILRVERGGAATPRVAASPSSSID